MGLFSAMVGVLVETAKLPVSIVKDVVMSVPTGEVGKYTTENLERIKEEAKEADRA